MGLTEPYEVVSSEDILSRIYSCNETIRKMKNDKEIEIEDNESDRDLPPVETMFRQFWSNIEDNWNWTDDYIIFGSDVFFSCVLL